MGRSLLIWSLIYKIYPLLSLCQVLCWRLNMSYALIGFSFHALSLQNYQASFPPLVDKQGRLKCWEQDQRSLFEFNEVKIIYLQKLRFQGSYNHGTTKMPIPQYAASEYCRMYTLNNDSHSHNNRMSQVQLFFLILQIRNRCRSSNLLKVTYCG